MQELEIQEKEERRLRREESSKKVKEEDEAGPSGPLDTDGVAPLEAQLSGLDERYAQMQSCIPPRQLSRLCIHRLTCTN